VAGPTHAEQLPQPTQEIQAILDQTSRHVSVDGDIWMKAILTPNFSTLEARREAEEMWKQAGGSHVDEWYRSYYANNRSDLIMTEDIYQIFREQRAFQKRSPAGAG
jgi:putative aldouronate transport system substrate-binding protein